MTTQSSVLNRVTAIGPVGSDGEEAISFTAPYQVMVTIKGTAALLFHRWSVEGVKEKADASKNSKAKKTDDLQSYVYRLANGHLAIPGEYLRMAIVQAARYRQDPRSPRKSAMDLYKAGLVCLMELADLGKQTWDYQDQRRAVVQRNGITRIRPAMLPGWSASFELEVLTPEYIEPAVLNDVIGQAGKLVGIGDFRPTFGRFQVVNFDIL